MEFLVDYIIPFVVVLTVLVFIHELGHYWVARYNGVKVEVFSIGFGPELFGWTDRAETRWKISLIPLGGYVRMYGDQDEASRPDTKALKKMSEELRSQSLHHKPVGQRIAVSAAGPFANFAFAIITMAVLFAVKGQPILPAKIGDLVPGKAAALAGLKVGDEIVKVNEQPIKDFTHLRDIVRKNAGHPLDIQVLRDQEELMIKIIPESVDETTGEKKPVGQLGIRPASPEFIRRGPVESLYQAVKVTIDISTDTLIGVGQMIIRTRSSDELGGILSIGDMAGQSAKSGLVGLLWFMALLSINLGLINLFPIPMLDGGHLLFYGIEAIRGKPVGEKAQEYAFRLGFLVVIGLMLMSTWNDLSRYKVFSWLTHWF